MTVFATRATPAGVWGTGFGAALTSTWFKALNLEVEAARLPGSLDEQILTTFTGSAFFAPPIGKFVPYIGVGIGLFRQSAGDRSDTGVLRTTGLGARLLLHDLLVLRVDYRFMHLSGEPFLTIDRRLSAGLGLKF